MKSFNEGKEELRANNVQLVTVRTCDDASREIGQNKNKNNVVICSNTVGRYLVTEIVRQYPHVNNVNIYTHGIALHVD